MIFQVPEPLHHWWWLFPTITAAGGLAGGVLGSLFSKWGEITAIQSRIDTVVKQNDRIVESTEKIKKEVLEDTWAKQRHWELKRDTAVELMRLFGTLFEKSLDIFKAAGGQRYADESNNSDRKLEARARGTAAFDAFMAEMAKFWQQEQIAKLIFPAEVHQKLENLKGMLSKFAGETSEGAGDAARYKESFERITETQEDLARTLRRDLKIPD
jgi:hypothetical protein